MTRLGKLLILGNLVLSVTMAMWALGLYTSQHLPADQATTGAKPGGVSAKAYNRAQAQVFELQARVAALNKSLEEATARWQTAQDQVVTRENAYYVNQPWYNTQLRDVESDPGNLQTVAYENGQLVLDPKHYGRPLLRPAYDPPLTAPDRDRLARGQQPTASELLRSASFYRPKIVEANEAFHRLSVEFGKLVERDAQLTEELAGKTPAKGLWTRLADEETKQRQVRAEAQDLNDIWMKTQVDADGLLRRQQQMQAREKELSTKVGTRTVQP